MEHAASNHEIRATLWPQRLVNVRRSLNRSSRIIVLLGLLALTGCAIWATRDQTRSFNVLEFSTWFHPAYINSALIAIMMIYALRQISRTRQKLNPLGYPLLECVGELRGIEIWRSTEPLSLRPVHIHFIKPDKFRSTGASWDQLRQGWLRRAEKMRRLYSPHVAPLVDCGYGQGNTFYSVVALPAGQRLDEFIEAHGPCPVDRTLYLLEQVADAISNAHDQGLFQLTLQPRHIFIGRRSHQEDWVTMELFGYEADEDVSGETHTDAAAFARIATGMLTGAWPELSTPRSALETSLREKNIPETMIHSLLKHQNNRHTNAPAIASIIAELRAGFHGEPWTRERAAAWWSGHRKKEPAG